MRRSKIDIIAESLQTMGRLTASEIKGMGYVNPSTAILKLENRGMNIQRIYKGTLINGRRAEEHEYHLIPETAQEPTDKWDKLKARIRDKTNWMIALDCKGATYKALNWILREMEVLEK